MYVYTYVLAYRIQTSMDVRSLHRVDSCSHTHTYSVTSNILAVNKYVHTACTYVHTYVYTYTYVHTLTYIHKYLDVGRSGTTGSGPSDSKFG